MNKKKERRPCECPECKATLTLPTSVGEHEYRLEYHEDDLGRHPKWRWRCSCSPRPGQWNYQGDWSTYHAWRRHAGLDRRPRVRRSR